jgi:hypothetical protein
MVMIGHVRDRLKNRIAALFVVAAEKRHRVLQIPGRSAAEAPLSMCVRY